MPDNAVIESTATDQGTDGGSIATAPSLSLDDVFGDSAAGATHSEDTTEGEPGQADATGEETEGEEEAAVEEGEEAPKTTKKPQPKTPETVSVKVRGQEFQVPASVAPAFKALQDDYKALESEFTKRNMERAAEGKTKTTDTGEAERTARITAKLAEYDGQFLKTIDEAKDGRADGMTEMILKLIDSRLSHELQTSVQDRIRAAIQPFQETIQATMGDTIALRQVQTALEGDLEHWGVATDAVSPQAVLDEMKAIRGSYAADVAPRAVYQDAIIRLLNRPKKPGPKPQAKTETSPATVVDTTRRPANAPNVAAPRSSGGQQPSPSQSSGPIHRSNVDWDQM